MGENWSIFTVNDKDYLCTVDYYSDVFEIDNLYQKKDGKAIMRILKKHFSNHGIPEIIFSDNGPPFSSSEFKKFATDYQFEHVTSSPGYPQSNGKVENAVKIAKGPIRKSQESNGDFYLNLLSWRNTPTECLDSSPAQRLYSRRTRTLIPTAKTLLQQEITADVKAKKMDRQTAKSEHYNKTAKKLSELKRGDVVRIQPLDRHRKRWEKAKVVRKVNIRSYIVETEDGRTYRRNRRHLRFTKEPFISYDDLVFEEPDNPEVPQPNREMRADNQTELRRSSRPKEANRDEDFVYH